VVTLRRFASYCAAPASSCVLPVGEFPPCRGAMWSHPPPFIITILMTALLMLFWICNPEYEAVTEFKYAAESELQYVKITPQSDDVVPTSTTFYTRHHNSPGSIAACWFADMRFTPTLRDVTVPPLANITCLV
jgi:hypothetical protein